MVLKTDDRRMTHKKMKKKKTGRCRQNIHANKQNGAKKIKIGNQRDCCTSNVTAAPVSCDLITEKNTF